MARLSLRGPGPAWCGPPDDIVIQGRFSYRSLITTNNINKIVEVNTPSKWMWRGPVLRGWPPSPRPLRPPSKSGSLQMVGCWLYTNSFVQADWRLHGTRLRVAPVSYHTDCTSWHCIVPHKIAFLQRSSFFAVKASIRRSTRTRFRRLVLLERGGGRRTTNIQSTCSYDDVEFSLTCVRTRRTAARQTADTRT